MAQYQVEVAATIAIVGLLRVLNLVLQHGFRWYPDIFTTPVYIQLYLYTTGYFNRRVILKQQFTIEKGYYANDSTKEHSPSRSKEPNNVVKITLRWLLQYKVRYKK